MSSLKQRLKLINWFLLNFGFGFGSQDSKYCNQSADHCFLCDQESWSVSQFRQAWGNPLFNNIAFVCIIALLLSFKDSLCHTFSLSLSLSKKSFLVIILKTKKGLLGSHFHFPKKVSFHSLFLKRFVWPPRSPCLLLVPLSSLPPLSGFAN